jgi:hypothetical protein
MKGRKILGQLTLTPSVRLNPTKVLGRYYAESGISE